MENIGNIARLEGVVANLAINGKTVVLAGGKSFQCLLDVAPSIDPGMSLGMDIREGAKVHAMRSALPTAILAAATDANIRATIEGVTVDLTKREDNLAMPMVSFEVVRVL